MELSKDKTYAALLPHNRGRHNSISICGQNARTVNNFVALSRKKFYDNTIFHRIIKDFMIQVEIPMEMDQADPDISLTMNYLKENIHAALWL